MSPASAVPSVDSAAAAFEELRARVPLVQSLTNIVAVNFQTNVLLASGATNAVIDNPHEAGGFARVADAVLINLGTPNDRQAESYTLAAEGANASGHPWVLDPVGVGGLPWRTELASGLLDLRPTAVRGNGSEIAAAAGLGGEGRGVDSTADAAGSGKAAHALLEYTEAVSASGPVDYVTGRVGGEIVTVLVHGGSDLLPRITSTGCALGALSAAYLAVAPDPFTGLVAAHLHFAVASELAATRARGPGTFVPAFLDALGEIGPGDLRAHGRVTTNETGAQ
jgi:hydroxyethylthiazole kinase